jgi:hypothetical protein
MVGFRGGRRKESAPAGRAGREQALRGGASPVAGGPGKRPESLGGFVFALLQRVGLEREGHARRGGGPHQARLVRRETVGPVDQIAQAPAPGSNGCRGKGLVNHNALETCTVRSLEIRAPAERARRARGHPAVNPHPQPIRISTDASPPFVRPWFNPGKSPRRPSSGGGYPRSLPRRCAGSSAGPTDRRR